MPGVSVNIFGLIENMAYFIPEDDPEKKYYIFGENGGEKLTEKFSIPHLGQIPLIQEIREGSDDGCPIVNNNESNASKYFVTIAQNLAQQIAILNANTEKVKEVRQL